jgi:fructosamine-3-kinase
MPDRHTTQAAASAAVDPQRLRALERANEIRLARAECKRQIAEGEVSVAEVLLEVPAHARSWAVGDLLMSQHRWGTSRCRKFLWKHHINETKQIGALTERQRRLLASHLDPGCGDIILTTDQFAHSRERELALV